MIGWMGQGIFCWTSVPASQVHKCTATRLNLDVPDLDVHFSGREALYVFPFDCENTCFLSLVPVGLAATGTPMECMYV